MKKTTILLCTFIVVGCGGKRDQDETAVIGDKLGTTRFVVTGNTAAQKHMQRGIKLLHHMTYSEADKAFAAAIDADPDCALAYWGRAMTIVHPVWPDIPDEALLRQGWELINKASTRKVVTDHERAYIAALATYYKDGWNREEKDRLADLDKAWEKVYAEYPDDVEAACFFALFHLAPARFLPADSTYRVQLTSGAIVSRVLERIPDHPGALHYQIHAFDFPILAGRALDVCRDYSEIAPQVPHALHMPTHIYTRRGMWEKSIELNLRSAQASWDLWESVGELSFEYLHALDYAVYAYLQRGQQAEAESLMQEIRAYEGAYQNVNLPAAAFALAAIPARCALEGRKWEVAAQLEPRSPESFPWDDRFIAQESIVFFARAIGAVRAGNLDSARLEIAAHLRLADQISERFPGTYWDKQARTQQLSARAWLAFVEGSEDEALVMMREAADLEAVTEKEAVTPGEVLPAGELMGDMLTEMARYAEAVAAYESVLDRSPNRFHSLFGSGRAAETAGENEKAAKYYKALLAVAADHGATDRDALKQAATFLDLL